MPLTDFVLLGKKMNNHAFLSALSGQLAVFLNTSPFVSFANSLFDINLCTTILRPPLVYQFKCVRKYPWLFLPRIFAARFVVRAAKAFARNTSQCVYIIDYFRQGFLYVSDNLAYLCGIPAAEIRNHGYEILQNVVERILAGCENPVLL